MSENALNLSLKFKASLKKWVRNALNVANLPQKLANALNLRTKNDKF